MGVVRVWPGRVSRGAKIFGHGGLDPGIWTDDGSGYVELWGGLTPTFWDSTALASGAVGSLAQASSTSSARTSSQG